MKKKKSKKVKSEPVDALPAEPDDVFSDVANSVFDAFDPQGSVNVMAKPPQDLEDQTFFALVGMALEEEEIHEFLGAMLIMVWGYYVSRELEFLLDEREMDGLKKLLTEYDVEFLLDFGQDDDYEDPFDEDGEYFFEELGDENEEVEDIAEDTPPSYDNTLIGQRVLDGLRASVDYVSKFIPFLADEIYDISLDLKARLVTQRVQTLEDESSDLVDVEAVRELIENEQWFDVGVMLRRAPLERDVRNKRRAVR
jgi:hypothetical protein